MRVISLGRDGAYVGMEAEYQGWITKLLYQST